MLLTLFGYGYPLSSKRRAGLVKEGITLLLSYHPKAREHRTAISTRKYKGCGRKETRLTKAECTGRTMKAFIHQGGANRVERWR